MFFSSQTEVYIYREPVDMRKGHDGLAGIVESQMNLELLSGSIFLFVNKTRRLCKAIYFDGPGLVIIHKRMEVGSIMNFLAFGKVQKKTVSELVRSRTACYWMVLLLEFKSVGGSISLVNLRDDLKTNPEYLNEVIKVMDSSIVALKKEFRILYEKLENSSQSELIELKDKIAMLNK